MKTTIAILTLVLFAGALRAQDTAKPDPALSGLLRDALFAEEADRDLVKAERVYREILRRFDSERAYAATATLRLGEVLIARGEKEEAEKMFARVLEEFGDQKAVAEVAATRLGDRAAPDAPAPSRLEQILAESPDLLTATFKDTTPLERAAGAGEVDVVAYLLEKGVPADGEAAPFRYAYGKGNVLVSPLGRAVRNGHSAVVDRLIAGGATLDEGLLHTAAAAGNLAGARRLLAAGMDIDLRFGCEAMLKDDPGQSKVERGGSTGSLPGGDKQPPEWQMTALEISTYSGFGELARALLEAGASATGLDGEPSTALYHAIDKGDEALVETLLEEGAEANGFWNATVRRGRGQSPLLVASSRGHAGILKSLLAAGADKEAADAGGLRALHYARGGAVQVLIKAGADVNALSANWGPPLANIDQQPEAVEKVRALLAAGADPNLKGDEGNPPLVVAASMLNLEAVNMLLEAGADISAEGSNGRALDFVAGNGDSKIVARLLKAGADPNQANANGYTAIRAAVVSGSPAVVAMLLDAGADPNQVNANGWTAFRAAVVSGSPAVVALLLDAGANPNGPGGDSPPPITALSDGLEENRMVSRGVPKSSRESMAEAFDATVRLLVEAGADVNAVAPVEIKAGSYRKLPRKMKNGMGEPVLFKAARWGNAELVRYLISKGAKLQVGDEHAYEVVEKENAELRAELFLSIFLDKERRAGVLRVVIAERGEIVAETAPLADEACTYSLLEAFGFSTRNAHLSTGDAQVWRLGQAEPIIVNLRELAASGDPAKDVALQWGDGVEFRAPKDDADGAFSEEEIDFLYKYLKRTVSIKWLDDQGEETANMSPNFSLNTRSSIGDGLTRPGYYPGAFYYMRGTTLGAGYLVPLLKLGGKYDSGHNGWIPKAWVLTREVAGKKQTIEFTSRGKPSPWLEGGDEIVFRGRVPHRDSTSPIPGRRRSVPLQPSR